MITTYAQFFFFFCILYLVDFRFGKKLSGKRTFTICGMTNSSASEIVQGKGHGGGNSVVMVW